MLQYQLNGIRYGIKEMKRKIVLIPSPENYLMLTDDLLNKFRKTPPSSDCQIVDDSLATIPCLGRLQILIRTDSLEII